MTRRLILYTKQDFTPKGFNTFYFIDLDTFYLFLNWFSTRVSDNRKYVCGRKLLRVYKYTKIQKPRFQRNYIFARDQKSDLHGTSFQSSPKVNSMLITRYNESLQHPTIAVLLMKILLFFFRPLSSVHLFQSNQRFQAIEFVDPHVSEKF